LLRRVEGALPGRNGWILFFDTKCINVWCVAGKGTFGTEELLRRIASSNLEKIVNHRTLILPQLAGPGVAGFEVTRRSGFRVIYGPVKALDLPSFLGSGFAATHSMRTKTFTAGERLVLIPVEVVGAPKIGLLVLIGVFLISFLLSGALVEVAFRYSYNAAMALVFGILAGAAAAPLLLPWLPGRSFSVKGILPKIAGAIVFLVLQLYTQTGQKSIELYSWLFCIPAISSYLSMNFTGSSTFTSLAGVRREIRWAVPLQIGAATCSLVLWITSLIMR